MPKIVVINNTTKIVENIFFPVPGVFNECPIGFSFDEVPNNHSVQIGDYLNDEGEYGPAPEAPPTDSATLSDVIEAFNLKIAELETLRDQLNALRG